ncbi:MAG: type IV secretory system conjugative DNA transfer family protein [Carboxylicivirga sp.]|nr:type IV secretory system conjugative DNA transfer family protein [Carboxylicivirga sp.]
MSQERKVLLLFTIFLTIVVLVDYFTTIDTFLIQFIPVLDGYINNQAFTKIFIDNGEFIRGAFIGIFTIYCYNEAISMDLKKHDFNKGQYIAMSFLFLAIFGGAFVCINRIDAMFELEPVIMMVVYLMLWILTFITAYHFAKSLSIRTKIKGDETDLNGHDEKFGMISIKTVENRWINILNLYQGNFVCGSAGSGKTASVGHPILWGMLKEAFTGIVYSYKMFDLANVVYTVFKHHPEIGEKVDLKIINFTDMHRTNRINPLNAAYIKEEAYIEEYVSCIAKNLNKEWIKKTDFFATSAMLLLRAVIVFLWRKHPEYCSIPHAFSVINRFTPDEIIDLLQHDDRSKVISSSFTAGKDATDQTAGVISSLKNLTLKLDNEKMFYVLSGDDVDLNLNHPDHPTMLVLANNPQTEDTITPVISLMVTVARKLMNVPCRVPSTIALDEAPTLFIPEFDRLPATGRSNKIAVLYMCQDLSQMEKMYGKVEAQSIRGSLSNTFFGNSTEHTTAKYVQDSFGKVDKIIENQSMGNNKSTGSVGQNNNISYNVQERFLIKDSDVNSFKIGEFAGKIAGEEKKPFFRVRFDLLENQTGIAPDEYEVPEFSLLDDQGQKLDSDTLIRENYYKIIDDVEQLRSMYVESELEKAKKL